MRGRIRSVKPELLTDEELWDLGQETGLPVLQAFVGMWMYADREGRFEWRPRALGALILPYWEGDFARVLDALATRGFLVKYACGTREYGYVKNFHKHQTPNNRENPSELPEPPEVTDTSTRAARVDDASGTRELPVPIQKKSSGNGILGTDLGGVASATRDTDPWQTTEGKIRSAFTKRYVAKRAAEPVWPVEHKPRLATLAKWLDALDGDLDANLAKLMDGFFSDGWMTDHGFPFAGLANNPAKYLNPPSMAAAGRANGTDDLHHVGTGHDW